MTDSQYPHLTNFCPGECGKCPPEWYNPVAARNPEAANARRRLFAVEGDLTLLDDEEDEQ